PRRKGYIEPPGRIEAWFRSGNLKQSFLGHCWPLPMSRDPSNSDWWERDFESARRRVKQLEIEACRIRTELARLEVANATGVVPDPVVPDTEHPVANLNSEEPIEWQPAAEQVPDRMEVLVGAPPVAASPITTEDLAALPTEAAPAENSWVSGLVNR